MALRHQTPQKLCSECRELTDAMCLRCERPLCSEHMPAEGRRCEPCEETYSNQEEALTVAIQKSAPGHLGTILKGIVGTYVLMGLLVESVTVGVVALGVGVFGGAWALLESDHRLALRAKKKARGRFLEERKVSLLTSANASADEP